MNWKEIPDFELKEPFYKKGMLWTSPFNFEFEDKTKQKEKVIIHDVTLRDGDQTPGVVLREDERIRIAQALAEMKIPRIEAGMPLVSKAVENAMRSMVDAKYTDTKIYSFIRAVQTDVELSHDIGVDGMIIEYLVNPAIIKHAYKDTPEGLVNKIAGAINLAKKKDVDVAFMGWDWFRAPIQFTKWLVSELCVRSELDGIVMVDTFGCTTPDAVGEMFNRFKNWFPNLRLEFHGHNDLGLANACALSAVQNGADVVHGSIIGLGDRCGNTATEEISVLFECHKGIKTGIDLSKIASTTKLVSNISKVNIYDSKPVIGQRPYLVETGIGMDLGYKLKKANKEKEYANFGVVISPEVIGRTDKAEYVLGKSSGKASIRLFLDKYGISATEDQIKIILAMVVEEATITKSLVSEVQFLEIVKKVIALD